MKSTSSISSLLGLSQEDLALLLKISRSQFSMYESGSRNIPVASKEFLSEIVTYVNTPEASVNSPAMAEQQALKQKAVYALLKENLYQQELTTRRIASAEAKCDGKLKALQVVEFLSRKEETNNEADRALLGYINHKTKKYLKKQGLGMTYQLQLKLDLLQLEKMILDAEIRKFERSLANTRDEE